MSSERDKTSDDEYEPVQFSIASLLQLIAGVAFCLAILLGLHPAVLLAVDAGVIGLAILTLMRASRVAGLTIPKLTFVEWFAVVTALMMIHLALGPSVRIE